MYFLKFTQVWTKICIILTDSSYYKEYLLHHKVKILDLLEPDDSRIWINIFYGVGDRSLWRGNPSSQELSLLFFFSMEGGIRPWRLDFLPQINKHGLRVY